MKNIKFMKLPTELTPDQQVKIESNISVSSSGCWNWNGHRNHGYGVVDLKGIGRCVRLHRLMWQVYNKQEIPSEKIVRHMCHNPQCCNPQHLVLGSQAENVIDKVEADRQSKGKGTGSAKINENIVIEIRTRYAYENISFETLAKEYGLGHTIVGNIVLGNK